MPKYGGSKNSFVVDTEADTAKEPVGERAGASECRREREDE